MTNPPKMDIVSAGRRSQVADGSCLLALPSSTRQHTAWKPKTHTHARCIHSFMHAYIHQSRNTYPDTYIYMDRYRYRYRYRYKKTNRFLELPSRYQIKSSQMKNRLENFLHGNYSNTLVGPKAIWCFGTKQLASCIQVD